MQLKPPQTILKLFGTKVRSTENYKAPFNTRENIRKTCRNYDLVDSMNMGIAWDYRSVMSGAKDDTHKS